MSKFSNLKLRYKVGVGAVTGAAILAATGGAFAYFTDSGSGTGSASVGTSTPFVISGTDASANYPGQSTTVNLSVQNPGSGNQEIGTIYLSDVKACDSTSSWKLAANGNPAGCYKSADTTSPSGTEITTCESFDPGNAANAAASDWYMADVVENQDVAANSTVNGTSNPVLTHATGTLVMNDLNASQDSCKNANLTLLFATR